MSVRNQTIAYLTGVINNYEREISKGILPAKDIENYKNTVADLGSLLDYIIEIPCENTDVAENNARYVNRIAELQNENKNSDKEYRRLFNEQVRIEKQNVMFEKENKGFKESLAMKESVIMNLKGEKDFALKICYEVKPSPKLENNEEIETLTYKVKCLIAASEISGETMNLLIKENRILKAQLAKATGPKWID